MDGNSWSFALSLLALACSGLSAIYTGARTPSKFAERALAESVGQGKAREAEIALFTAQREAWHLEFQAIADRCDETLDRAESKRRRVAATQSRAQAGQPEAPQTREQIIDAARRRTLGVQ